MAESFIEKTKKSKLGQEEAKKKENIFLTSKNISSIRSFRLDSQTWQEFQKLLEQVNNISGKRISASRLVKGLVYLGKKSKEEKLVKILKEVSI
jgi:hypothetical protein